MNRPALFPAARACVAAFVRQCHAWRVACCVAACCSVLHAGAAERWDDAYFHALGLHKLLGTVQYPETA